MQEYMQQANDIGQVQVTFRCPECSQRVETWIPYIKKDNAKTSLTAAGWCGFPYCEARHKMNYKVVAKEERPTAIKIEEFSSNDEICNKRFKILAWR